MLNLGVRPDDLISSAGERFRASGGAVLDCTAASEATVHTNGVALHVSGGSSTGSEAEPLRSKVTSKVLLDCMGHASPVVRQSRRESSP